jgi:hypothetical protein
MRVRSVCDLTTSANVEIEKQSTSWTVSESSFGQASAKVTKSEDSSRDVGGHANACKDDPAALDNLAIALPLS